MHNKIQTFLFPGVTLCVTMVNSQVLAQCQETADPRVCLGLFKSTEFCIYANTCLIKDFGNTRFKNNKADKQLVI